MMRYSRRLSEDENGLQALRQAAIMVVRLLSSTRTDYAGGYNCVF